MNQAVISDFRREGFAPFVLQKGVSFSGHDKEALLALPDSEFAERYLGEMTRYFYEHGSQMLDMEVNITKMTRKASGLIVIACGNCHQPIECAADLRRYYGDTLDAGCFEKRWIDDRPDYVKTNGEESLIVRYWDRISTL